MCLIENEMDKEKGKIHEEKYMLPGYGCSLAILIYHNNPLSALSSSLSIVITIFIIKHALTCTVVGNQFFFSTLISCSL